MNFQFRRAAAPWLKMLRPLSNGWFGECLRAAQPRLDCPQWAENAGMVTGPS